MKLLKCIVFLLSILLFSACNGTNNGIKTTQKVEGMTNPAEKSVEKLLTAHEIDYDQTKIIQKIYITDRNGALMKNQNTEHSETLGKYEYGDLLEIIEIHPKWFGVRARITRQYREAEKKVEVTAWEVVYVQRSKTGTIDKIKLNQKDLYTVFHESDGNTSEYNENGIQYSGPVKIELIDAKLFESKKKTAIDLVLYDTTAHVKKDGILRLECQQKTVEFTDKITDNDDMETYEYTGQIPSLNLFIVQGSYWESYDYKLIDKITGEETQALGDFPFLSADKKKLISLYTNPYEVSADMEAYKIKNGQLISYISLSFRNWMPVTEEHMFWGNDNYFYVPVLHSKVFWQADGNYNKNYQYIRIKL